MQVIRSTTELAGRRVCVAIGFFDGVHLGHQQIIRQTVADARQHEADAVVITFDQHPSTVVAPERIPPLIYSTDQRLRSIQSLGVDQLLLLHFDQALSRQTGETFVRELISSTGHLISICVGATFTFGHRRSGNVALLRQLGSELRFAVHGLAAVSLDGEPVSSTRIRESIRSGNLDAAGQMLGRTYALAGKVTQGAQLGRKLGFPTANLEVTGRALPPNGVYAAHAEVNGRRHRAAVNIGCRPTVDGATPRVTVEAHLIDFAGELYGAEMELSFVGRIRDEQRFPSLDALRDQISKDISAARQMFT